MPKTTDPNRRPKYRLQKARGLAVVTIPGRGDVYLGPYDSPESHREYDRVVGLWLANGRRPSEARASRLTVAESRRSGNRCPTSGDRWHPSRLRTRMSGSGCPTYVTRIRFLPLEAS